MNALTKNERRLVHHAHRHDLTKVGTELSDAQVKRLPPSVAKAVDEMGQTLFDRIKMDHQLNFTLGSFTDVWVIAPRGEVLGYVVEESVHSNDAAYMFDAADRAVVALDGEVLQVFSGESDKRPVHLDD